MTDFCLKPNREWLITRFIFSIADSDDNKAPYKTVSLEIIALHLAPLLYKIKHSPMSIHEINELWRDSKEYAESYKKDNLYKNFLEINFEKNNITGSHVLSVEVIKVPYQLFYNLIEYE
jgi:hypothetical protein